jgi:hypothetical protein
MQASGDYAFPGETAMAKAKKQVATRRASKRGKTRTKAARKKLKPGRSKVSAAAKLKSKKPRRSKPAVRKAPTKTAGQAVDLEVKEAIIDVVEEPVPGTIVVTEYTISPSPEAMPKAPSGSEEE